METQPHHHMYNHSMYICQPPYIYAETIQSHYSKVDIHRQGIIFQNEENVYELTRTTKYGIYLKKLNTNNHDWDQVGEFCKSKMSQTLIKLMIPLIFNPQNRHFRLTTVLFNPMRLYMYFNYSCSKNCQGSHRLHRHQCLIYLSMDHQNKEYKIENLHCDLENLLKQYQLHPTIRPRFGLEVLNSEFAKVLTLKSYKIIGVKCLNNQCHLFIYFAQHLKKQKQPNEFIIHVYHDGNKFVMVNKICNYFGIFLSISNKKNTYYHLEKRLTSLIVHTYQKCDNNNNDIQSDHFMNKINGVPAFWTKFECCISIKGNYCFLIEYHQFYLLNMNTLDMKLISHKSPVYTWNQKINDILHWNSIKVIVIKKEHGDEMSLMSGWIRFMMRQNQISMYNYPPKYLIKLIAMYYCNEEMYLMRENVSGTHFYIWKFNVDDLFCCKIWK